MCAAGLFLAAGFLLFASQRRKTDPDAAQMRPEVLTEPRQTPVTPRPFSVESDRKTYLITPYFDYDQSALVVSTNNKLALKPVLQWFGWFDMLNVNDVCVVWGDNVASEVYKDMNFYQGAYTCFPRYKEGRAAAAQRNYRGNQLAHNHILTDNPELQRRLRGVRKGDQIRIKGKLVSYAYQGHIVRTSSFTREDNVCETIWLEDLEILNRHQPVLRIAMVLTAVAAVLMTAGLISSGWRIMTLQKEETGKKWTSWGRG